MNSATSFNCLIDNHGTLHAVLEMMKTMMEFDDTGYLPKIYVNNTIEDNVSAALQFYKNPRLNIRKGIIIEMLAAPGIDVGGIRRDFFSCVYQKLSSGYMDFFEGDGSRVRPVCTVSSLSSGILKTIGIMIGHSIIMSNIGFPLSCVMYYYMCGDLNTAIINLELDDASEKVSYYVKEISSSNKELNQLVDSQEMEDYLIESGGRDIPFRLSYKEEICEIMLIYDGLVKRKAYLDAIMEGLDSFKMKRVMCSNPKVFEPLFIGEPVSSARVKEAIKTLTPPGEDSIKQRILHTIGIYLDSCDEKGLLNFLLYCTGSMSLDEDNTIYIEFTDNPDKASVSVNTCNRILTVSTHINPIILLKEELNILVNDKSNTRFTIT
ncbi:uncharacterized protein [Dysidea avara]